MSSLHRIFVISLTYAKWAFRNPATYFFMVFFMPISILTPLLLIASDRYAVDVIAGALLFTAVSSTISDTSQNVSFDRYRKKLSFYVTSPIKPAEYMFGVALSPLEYNIFGTLLVLIIGMLIIKFRLGIVQVVSILMVVVAAWFISALLGFITGLYGPQQYQMNAALNNVLGFGLTFLAPTYYPIEILPPVLQKVSYISYTTHLALISKAIIRGNPVNMTNVAAVGIFLLLCVVIIIKGLQWRE